MRSGLRSRDERGTDGLAGGHTHIDPQMYVAELGAATRRSRPSDGRGARVCVPAPWRRRGPRRVQIQLPHRSSEQCPGRTRPGSQSVFNFMLHIISCRSVQVRVGGGDGGLNVFCGL